MGKIRTNLIPIIRDVQRSVINSRVLPRPLRSRAWAALGHSVHQSAIVNPDTFLGARTKLTVGAGTFMMLVTSTHESGSKERRAGRNIAKPVTIGNGVWIGACATVLRA